MFKFIKNLFKKEDKEKPAAIEKPVAEKKPVVIERPPELEKPAAAEQPAAEERVEEVKKPVSSKKPAAVEKPAAEEKPAVAKKPAATKKPSDEEKTAAEEKPAAAKKTALKEKSETEEKPPVSKKPAAAKKTTAAEKPAESPEQEKKPAKTTRKSPEPPEIIQPEPVKRKTAGESPQKASKQIPETPVIEQTQEVEIAIEDERSELELESEELTDKPVENEELTWLERLRIGLKKTRESFTRKIKDLIGAHHKIDDDFLEKLEEILISTDVGVKGMTKILEHFQEIAEMEEIHDHRELLNLLKEIFYVILDDKPVPIKLNEGDLTVIMLVGVNGTGKTTTIGKLAKNYKDQGKSVMLAAGDTFRAAAIEQLGIWAQRVGCDIIKYESGGDAAAVVFDAVTAAKARKKDILLIDTAGRLHTKSNLMEELKKVRRVIQKVIPDAPHEILLALDATTGQNAVNQAAVFHKEIDLTGLILTKLDGTAKGGIVVAIKEELKLPVKMIGVGEKVQDLHIFDPAEFIEALLS